MGNTYTRQSSYTDGDVIQASNTNNEFDQLVSAFNESTGHTHDGTSAEGGPITKLLGTSLTFGDATSGTDITITFDGESNDGVLKWMEDEDYFEFSDDILIATTEKLQFRDTAIYINSSADGQLDLVADTEIQISATTIDINGAADISGNLDVGGNLTVAGTTSFSGGTLTLGSDASDNVVFGSDVNSSIIPNTDSAFDLGSATQEWRDLFIDGTAHIDTLDVDVNATVAGTLGVTGILTTTATQVATGGITSGSNIVSDTDSTDDLGTTSVRWANLFVDAITATDQITATGFTGTLDGILGSGSAAAATVTSLDTSGAVNLNLTTDSTSSTSGALIVDGGVGIAKKLFVGTDLDVSGDVVIDDTALVTGILTTTAATVFNGGFASNANSTMGTNKRIQFRDAAIHIGSPADGDLEIAADDEIDITSTLIDINGAVDMSSTLAVAGVVTANAGVVVDNITIDGNDISTTNSNGTLTFTPNGGGNVQANTDSLTIKADDGESATLSLIADDADNNGDIWSFINSTANVLTINSDISGSDVAQATLTPNATVANSTTAFAGHVTVGHDLTLLNDGAVLGFGADNEITLTHVHNEGLIFNGSSTFNFRNANSKIHSTTDSQLDIIAATEIEITAPTIHLEASTKVDLDGNLDVSGTALVTGVLTTTAATVHNGGITMPDGAIAKFGTDADLQISHINGTGSLIRQGGEGNLFIQGSDSIVFGAGDGSETLATFTDDGGCTLNFNNAAKIATASGGVTVTGQMAATTMDLSGAAVIDTTLAVGAALVSGFTASVTGSVPFVAASNSTASTLTYGGLGVTRDKAGANEGTGISFSMDDDAGNITEYGYLGTIIEDDSNGAEDGSLAFYVTEGSAARARAPLRIQSSGRLAISNNLPIWSGSYGGALFLKGNNSTAARNFTAAIVDSNGAQVGSQTLILDNNGNVTIGDGNLVVASGHGIDFSAGAGGGSASNLLDEYEEGTYTLSDQSGAGLTLQVFVATYTKIGNQVFFEFGMIFPTTSDTTAVRLSLPFTAKNSDDNTGGGAVTTTSSGRNDSVVALRNNAFLAVQTNLNASATNANYSGKQLRVAGQFTTA